MIEGDAVIHELVLPAPAERVFDMFTDPRLLVRWIGISADLQARPGGRFRFEIMPGQFCEGRYVVVERPGRLVFTWGWTDPGFGLPPGTSRVEVTLTRSGDDPRQTRLRLVHTGLAGDLGLLHDDGWSRFLARLTAAGGGEEPPAFRGEEPTASGGHGPTAFRGEEPAASGGQGPAAYPGELPDERLAILRRQRRNGEGS